MAHSSSSGTEPWLAETYTKVARISLRPKSPKQYATVFVAKNERSSLLAVKEYHKSALKPENGRRRAEVRNEVELLAAVQNGVSTAIEDLEMCRADLTVSPISSLPAQCVIFVTESEI